MSSNLSSFCLCLVYFLWNVQGFVKSLSNLTTIYIVISYIFLVEICEIDILKTDFFSISISHIYIVIFSISTSHIFLVFFVFFVLTYHLLRT